MADTISISPLVASCASRWMEVVGAFNVRGGITTTMTAIHGKR